MANLLLYMPLIIVWLFVIFAAILIIDYTFFADHNASYKRKKPIHHMK